MSNDVNKVNEYTCEAIKVTKDLHSIRLVGVMDVNKFMKKNLSCFCCLCVGDNFAACKNLSWIQEWQVEILISNNTRSI